jgi:glyceraldehyde-3-phosphate dehydrogenase/erythrose-4-phosphate dehydrogenase
MEVIQVAADKKKQNKQYLVQHDGVGGYSKGQVIPEAAAGYDWDRLVDAGAVKEASQEEIDRADAEARSVVNTTGDMKTAESEYVQEQQAVDEKLAESAAETQVTPENPGAITPELDTGEKK